VSAWHDIHGDGPAVVFVHAGIADSRMWEPQLHSFSDSHTVVRLDLPGFGNSPIETNPVSYRGAVADALDAAGVERAAIVGTSLGGMVALDFALDSPERASALVLVGAGTDDHEYSAEMQAFDAAEEAALERGDLEAAVNANLEFWLAGPRRTLDDVDPKVSELVAEMQRRAFAQSEGHDDLRALRLDPPASQRLDEVRVPTLVVTGDEDVNDILVMGDRLARDIPGAERATIAGAAHLPNLEQPERFDRIVLGFLDRHGV
jgi:pimeloyl-ACP methyl ester carboxylesterase